MTVSLREENWLLRKRVTGMNEEVLRRKEALVHLREGPPGAGDHDRDVRRWSLQGPSAPRAEEINNH